jgi:hypothetical protein
VVASPNWNNGGQPKAGAATWGSGTGGVTGAVSAANSLVGDAANFQVGSGGVVALSNGNYVVASPNWLGTRGAATWGSGTTGITGGVGGANSLVGSSGGDYVGGSSTPGLGGITALSNGNYVVRSPNWNGSRGAATWASGTSGQTVDGSAIVSAQNSVVGLAANAASGQAVVDDPSHQAFVAAFPADGTGRVVSGFSLSQLTYARGQSQTVTITPALLVSTLNAGGSVVFQASNDITVNSPITATGMGGSLTFQAGRSIIINASINTPSSNVTLIANDQQFNGVEDAQRDAGNAVITMAAGTTLTALGLNVQLRDGAGKTNSDSGAITLQGISATTVLVTNLGLTTTSNIFVGPVTTSGTGTQ